MLIDFFFIEHVMSYVFLKLITEFQAELRNLPVSAKFLCFRGILQNSVISGLTLSIYAVIWLTCMLYQSTNRQAAQELMDCCVVYWQYLHTICSLCKVNGFYLLLLLPKVVTYILFRFRLNTSTCSFGFYIRKLLFTSWMVYKWNKSCRNS